jgi:hypothetical protein
MLREELQPSLHLLCFFAMAPFTLLTKIFWSGSTQPFEVEPASMLQLINIELEELDHRGRRSTEKSRRRYAFNPFVVCLTSCRKDNHSSYNSFETLLGTLVNQAI